VSSTPYKARVGVLIAFFYAAWIAGGLAAAAPPGARALVVDLGAPGSVLAYDPSSGSILAWTGSLEPPYTLLHGGPGGWRSLQVGGVPLAGCVDDRVAAAALAPPPGGALFWNGTAWLRASWGEAWLKAYASCSGDTAAVLYSGPASSTLLVYHGGRVYAAELPPASGVAVTGGGVVYVASEGAVVSLKVGEGAQALRFTRPAVGVAAAPPTVYAVLEAGEGGVAIVTVWGGRGVAAWASQGEPVIEAAFTRAETGRHQVDAAYVRPPAGWGRLACLTPSGNIVDYMLAFTRAFAFSAAGGEDSTLWVAGRIAGTNETAIAVVEDCAPALVPWPGTVYYVKPAAPQLDYSLWSEPPPETDPYPVEWAEAPVDPLAPAPAPTPPIEEYEAHVDYVMIAFTLAATGAAPALAAYRALTAYQPPTATGGGNGDLPPRTAAEPRRRE